MNEKPKPEQYGCSDYREEMRLMGLKRRLEKDGLSDNERHKLRAEVEALEAKMGMD